MFRMSMLLIDLQAARAVLWVRCRKCRKCLQMSGRSLVRDYGPGVMLVDLVRRLRCSKCALPADAAISSTAAHRSRARRASASDTSGQGPRPMSRRLPAKL
ncbi:hypothetical protein DDV93_14440 [Cereibacter johrii]|nr:hypothetical protein DDV93_14440 [Cereibacter johrii]